MAEAELARVRHVEALAKVTNSAAHIRDLLANTDKIVVFAHHRDVIAELFLQLDDIGAKPVRLVGGMTDAQKQDAVDRFQTRPEHRVFIGQLEAAGTGITLTAASTVVFVELDWVPTKVSQCEDRCHRIGQKNSVLVQHLVVEESLDVRILKSLLRKQRVIEQTLDESILPDEFDWVTAVATGDTEV